MELLQKHFDIALETPDGIKKLRELILTLAMQGKLVKQDKNDQPASELLKEIEAEKKRLVAEGKIRKQESLPPIKEDEIPYEVPEGWEWVRFGIVYNLEYGDNLSSEKRSNTGEFPVYGSNGIVGTHNKSFINSSCIVVGRKGSAGALNLSLSNGCCVTDVAYYCVPPKGIDLFFSYNLFQSLKLESFGKGIKPGINRNEVYKLSILLPPLAEQKRIVAKVDQLMALCDKLEVERNERDKKLLKVHTSGINQLLNAKDKTDFNKSWHFINNHFDKLYSVKDNVTELKKTILQLAVMGKLVPQDKNDQPASELLKEIEAEKKRLVAEGKYRTQEPQSNIDFTEISFKIPDLWEWCRIQDLGFVLGGKRLPKGYDFSDTPTPYRYLTVTNMKENTIIDNNIKYISEIVHSEIKKYIIKKEDIYITIAGTIGAVGFIPDKYDGMNLTENASRLVFFRVEKQFLVNVLSSLFIQNQFNILTNKMAQPKLSIRSILSTIIPLPPLAEQKRIVAKVDQLMVLCDGLKKGIVSAEEKRTGILNAVMGRV